jgi:hypothetical protein
MISTVTECAAARMWTGVREMGPCHWPFLFQPSTAGNDGSRGLESSAPGQEEAKLAATIVRFDRFQDFVYLQTVVCDGGLT